MADYKKKLGRLGVWWTFQSWIVVEVRVGVRTEDVGVVRLAQDVA